MQHVLETGKRVFSAAVAAATIAFSVGAGLLVSPVSVSAASAGDLIKGTSLSTVYYLGYDGDRYVFPNENTFNSWGLSFDDVTTISDAALSDIDLAGSNVTIRPGTYWVKVQNIANVYAVGPNGALYWVESAEVAEDLAGSDWESNLLDVPDVFFGDYTEGVSLSSATVPNGSMYEMGGAEYLAWDGEMLEVSSAGSSANNYMSRFVLDGSNIDDSGLTMGDEVTSEWTCLVDVAQTETCDGSSSATGDITISGSSSMPVGTTVTGGANSVEVFSFDVEAGSEDATLEGITLSLTGAGATTNLSAVYLYEGETRLTESRTVNSSTREVTFNSLDVEIPAGDEVTLTAKVTISASQTAADTFGFELESADMVTASGDVDGSFPIEGDEFTLSGSDSGNVTITKTGTIDDPTIGEDDAEIAEFKIDATGSEDASVEVITLKVDNASDHSDFNLWDGSEWLVACENTTSDQVVCDLSDSPFDIEEGDSNIFRLSADIGGQDADAVKVFVDNAIDVVAIGGDFGHGLTVYIASADSGSYDGTTCTSSAGNCSYSTVQGGEVTFAFNGPSAGDVQVDGQDQVLLEFSLTAAQEVTIKDLDIIVYGDDDGDNDATDAVDDSAGAAASDADGLINTADANLKDIKIINTDTGTVFMGPLELDSAVTAGDDADQTIDFTEDTTVAAGSTLNLAVTADIDSSATSGTEFAAALDVSGLSIEDANGDALSGSDIVPGSDLTGYNQEALSASLTIALASTPGDTTTVQGTDSHTVVGFTVTAGDASDVTITDMVLSAYGDADDTTLVLGGETDGQVEDYVESCSLYDGSTLVGGPEAPASTGNTITFDNMDWILEASDVVTLDVKCNLANPSETSLTYLSFDLADVSADITAEDADGDTVTATGDAVNGGTAATNIVTVNASGSLAVAIASDMPDADFLRTGSNNNLVATYRFTATNEAFTINTLTFSEEQAEDDTGTADSNGYANNVSTVSLAWDDMEGAAPSASMSGNAARFSGLSIPVAVDEPTDVEVYVNVPSTDRVSGGSSTSNEKIRMGLFVDTTGDDNFQVTGNGSGSTLDDDDQASAIGDDAFATDGVPTFVVKETYPSIARSSASPTTAVSGGRPEVLRFNVSASTGEDVVMNSILFKMTSSDIGASDWNTCDTTSPGTYVKAASEFDIFDRDNLSTALDTADAAWTLYKSTGAVCDGTAADLTYVRVTFSSDEVVSADDTKTYSLYMSAAGASADNDSVLFEVVTDPIIAQASFLSANDLTESNVAATDTTLSVTDGTAYTIGDVLCMDTADNACASGDELMLLVNISSNDLTVVRGYLGTAIDTSSANDAADDVDRMPSSFTWKDDGVAGSVGGQDDWWGSYLVDITDFSGASSVHF
jgi:hypothetical protein